MLHGIGGSAVITDVDTLRTLPAEELTAVANNIKSFTFRAFETYLVITAIYLGLSMALASTAMLVSPIAMTKRLQTTSITP